MRAPADVSTPPGASRLAAPDSSQDYARCLYAALRGADSDGVRTVLAVPPDDAAPLAAAVLDRLQRAATGSRR
jgi:L-threonylcarbamoyladenylate synthase